MQQLITISDVDKGAGHRLNKKILFVNCDLDKITPLILAYQADLIVRWIKPGKYKILKDRDGSDNKSLGKQAAAMRCFKAFFP